MTTTNKRRCTALRQDGQPCRAWAVRPEKAAWQPGSPRCAAHGGKTRFAARAGQTARAEAAAQAAQRHTEPSAIPQAEVLAPLVLNAQISGGIYDDYFSDVEFSALQVEKEEGSLNSELRLVRIWLRRMMMTAAETEQLAAEELESRARAIFRGAQIVANLLQVHCWLKEQNEGELPPGMGAALDILSEEWEVEL